MGSFYAKLMQKVSKKLGNLSSKKNFNKTLTFNYLLFRKLIIYICKVNQKENNIMPPPIKEFNYYLKSKNKQDIISLCSDLIKMEFIFSYHGKQSFFYSIVLLEFSEIYESKLIDLAERFNCNLTKMERFNLVPLLSRNRKQNKK